MLHREPTGGTLYHAYAKSVENWDANFTNKMAANYLQNCNIPKQSCPRFTGLAKGKTYEYTYGTDIVVSPTTYLTTFTGISGY